MKHVIIKKLEKIEQEVVEALLLMKQDNFKPKIFKVKSFLKSRIRGRQKQYLVKWSGYSDEYNSWEPASQLKKDMPKHFDKLVAEIK
jgi:hypothetical protein